MKLFSLIAFIAFPALISAVEFCTPKDSKCGEGIEPCCSGYYCKPETSTCKQLPNKWCSIEGLKCGPDVKPCCPDTHCDSATNKCVADESPVEDCDEKN